VRHRNEPAHAREPRRFEETRARIVAREAVAVPPLVVRVDDRREEVPLRDGAEDLDPQCRVRARSSSENGRARPAAMSAPERVGRRGRA